MEGAETNSMIDPEPRHKNIQSGHSSDDTHLEDSQLSRSREDPVQLNTLSLSLSILRTYPAGNFCGEPSLSAFCDN
jgi:hypothetical protein